MVASARILGKECRAWARPGTHSGEVSFCLWLAVRSRMSSWTRIRLQSCPLIFLDYQKAVTRDADGVKSEGEEDERPVIYAECQPWHAS